MYVQRDMLHNNSESCSVQINEPIVSHTLCFRSNYGALTIALITFHCRSPNAHCDMDC